MRFHEAPLLLSVEHAYYFVKREQPHVQPGGYLQDWCRSIVPFINQIADNGLHPGRTGFVGGRNDDVAIAVGERVPARRIYYVILIGVLDLRKLYRRFIHVTLAIRQTNRPAVCASRILIRFSGDGLEF